MALQAASMQPRPASPARRQSLVGLLWLICGASAGGGRLLWANAAPSRRHRSPPSDRRQLPPSPGGRHASTSIMKQRHLAGRRRPPSVRAAGDGCWTRW
jgi:hypothetical protein